MIARILIQSISMVAGICVLGGVLSKIFSKTEE